MAVSTRTKLLFRMVADSISVTEAYGSVCLNIGIDPEIDHEEDKTTSRPHLESSLMSKIDKKGGPN